jgi:hypothetical protein
MEFVDHVFQRKLKNLKREVFQEVRHFLQV